MTEPQITTFLHIYPFGTGIEYPATPEAVKRVIASMNEHQHGEAPFVVKLRFDNGSSVIVRPKRKAVGA